MFGVALTLLQNVPEGRELVTQQVSYFGSNVRTRLCLNDEGLIKVHEVLYLLMCDHPDIAYAPHIPAVGKNSQSLV